MSPLSNNILLDTLEPLKQPEKNSKVKAGFGNGRLFKSRSTVPEKFKDFFGPKLGKPFLIVVLIIYSAFSFAANIPKYLDSEIFW